MVFFLIYMILYSKGVVLMSKLSTKLKLILSLSSFFIGVIMSVNWIPVSTAGMTNEEKMYLLEIGSINYRLGRVVAIVSALIFFFVTTKSLYLRFLYSNKK